MIGDCRLQRVARSRRGKPDSANEHSPVKKAIYLRGEEAATRCDMRPLSTFFCASLILVNSPAAAQTPPPLSTQGCGGVSATSTLTAAEEAYRRARVAWSAIVYPNAVSFVTTVLLRRAGSEVVSHYRGEEEFLTGDLHVDRVSDEERARPTSGSAAKPPFDVNISSGRSVFGAKSEQAVAFQAPVGPSKSVKELLGAPRLSTAYAFGLRDGVPMTASDTATRSTLKTIGSVSVVSRNYEISCLASTDDDAGLIHLGLRPTHDPGRLRIRQLWIDPHTFATVKMQTAGNFSDGPPTRTEWVITYKQVDGVTYIDREWALGPLDYGRGKMYENVTIAFENLVAERRVSVRSLLRQAPLEDDLREP